jgi:Holliday junction DNA helicase RuvA
VGKKTAARLCVDLREKATKLLERVAGPSLDAAVPEEFQHGTAWDDALSALTNLGYRPAEARAALARSASASGAVAEVEDLVKAALQNLAKTRTSAP